MRLAAVGTGGQGRAWDRRARPGAELEAAWTHPPPASPLQQPASHTQPQDALTPHLHVQLVLLQCAKLGACLLGAPAGGALQLPRHLWLLSAQLAAAGCRGALACRGGWLGEVGDVLGSCVPEQGLL